MSERPPGRCSTMLRSDSVAPLSSTQTNADPGFRPFRPKLILAPLHGPECVVGGLPEQLEWWNRSWAHGEGSG